MSAMFFPGGEFFDQFGGAARFVVLVVAHEGFRDSEMPEQMAAVPRVLARDEVRALEHFERAQRDVAEIADGRGDDEEHCGMQLRVEG